MHETEDLPRRWEVFFRMAAGSSVIDWSSPRWSLTTADHPWFKQQVKKILYTYLQQWIASKYMHCLSADVIN